MDERSRACSVWLGSETGILKGVSLDRKRAFNFCNSRELSRDQEVRALCWGDAAQSELLVGCVDGSVKTFSTEKGAFTDARRFGEPAEGCFTGLEAPRGTTAYVTCVEAGTVRVWREESGESACKWSAGPSVSRMRANPADSRTVATGGKENGLKVWDLERPDAPLFSAKNLRDDWLDLRRPYWIKDLDFIPESQKLVTCTAYHQIHVFDPSSPQRRPVLEAEFGEYPLTALALPAGGSTVVVGNTQGQLAQLDLRKGLVRGVLKGLSGGVRSLRCHATQPLVASCGLDRFLRIHSLDDRRLVHRVYLKSRLNCVLLSGKELKEVGETEGETEVKEEEEDEVWGAMEQVGGEETAKRKTTEQEETTKKKKKDV